MKDVIYSAKYQPAPNRSTNHRPEGFQNAHLLPKGRKWKSKDFLLILTPDNVVTSIQNYDEVAHKIETKDFFMLGLPATKSNANECDMVLL